MRLETYLNLFSAAMWILTAGLFIHAQDIWGFLFLIPAAWFLLLAFDFLNPYRRRP